MQHLIEPLTTSDGLKLHREAWLPDGKVKGMLAYSHGLGEHLGRYAHMGQALADAGYGLCMADLRGHGRSPGKRGHVSRWEEFQIDFAAIRESARALAPEAAQFFGGHSLGGLVALSAAVENPPGYQGVVVSAPALRAAYPLSPFKVTVAKIMSRLAPGTQITNDLPTADLSRDESVVKAYETDPLVHDLVTTRMAAETFAQQDRVIPRAAELRLPLLIVQGSEDRVVSVEATRQFFEAVSSPDKTLKIYEGSFHEVHNDHDRETLFNDVIAWLDAHSEPHESATSGA